MAFQITNAMKDAGIQTLPGEYTVVTDFVSLPQQIIVKPSHDWAAAVMLAGESLSLCPIQIHALKITQSTVLGRINIECFNGEQLVCTVMLCSESEDK